MPALVTLTLTCDAEPRCDESVSVNAKAHHLQEFFPEEYPAAKGWAKSRTDPGTYYCPKHVPSRQARL